MDDNKFVIFLLIERLQNFLIDEAQNVNPKLKNHISDAIQELSLLFQLFLQYAEGSSPEMVAKFLNIIYAAEDALDTFISRKAVHRRTQNTGFKKRWCQQPIVYLASLWSQRLFINEINRLKTELRNLGGKRSLSLDVNGQVAGSSFETAQVGRKISAYQLDDERISGRFHMDLLEEILELKSYPRVISLTGEGGLGKTTVARYLYDWLSKRYTKTHAWIRVQEVSKVRDILVDMLRQIDDEEAEEPFLEEELMAKISDLLEGKSYIIVLDDVRTSYIWEAIKGVFPVQESGPHTTVIVTTRCEDVVQHANLTRAVPRLDNKQSWSFFLEKVQVANDDKLKISALNYFKEEILKICDGLPLAIILLAGLLSTKELSHQDLSRVIEHTNKLGGDILALSYEDLLSSLQPCFLYLGLFPRAYEIPVRRLLHLWVAERFVLVTPSSPKEMLAEDLADMYFQELISRNMIEVVRWRLDGSPRTCQMSGLLYDFFSQKAANIGFFYVHRKSRFTPEDQPKFVIRRLASHSGIRNEPSTDGYIQHIYSYVSFNNQKHGSPAIEIGKFIKKIILKRDYGLLKVLDLEGVYKPRLPKKLGKLLNLRYLGLRSTALDLLPESVGDLPCLETLDLKHTYIYSFPKSILKANSLHHLYMNGVDFNSSVQKSPLGSLTKLQTLCGISVKSPVIDLNKLTALKKLGLTCNSASAEKSISLCISVELTMLQSLRLKSIDEKSGKPSDINLMVLAEHKKLTEMYLMGKLQQEAVSNSFLPPNLKVLTLSSSKLGEDPMPELGKLPHLNSLRLFGSSYTGKKMSCPSGSFPKLHVLKLWKLENLEEWTVEKGAMPNLRELEIRNCENLKEASWLEEVSSLKELILTKMKPNFKYKVGNRTFTKENNWEFPSSLKQDDGTIQLRRRSFTKEQEQERERSKSSPKKRERDDGSVLLRRRSFP